ncbi:MAG: tyrosine-type recombinase/integrase [Alkaliphilus sp.]
MGISFKKREIKPIEYLTQDSLKILFLKPDTKKSKERRNLIIMVLLYDTGAKVQELIDLKVRDVRLAEPATITLIGKGKKIRHVPIMGKTCDLLKQYMDENHLCDNGKQNKPLFSSSNNKPFTRPGITYILGKTLAKARESNPQRIFPKKLTPHMLRHTKAVHLLEAGINLIYIRDFLGHVNITTTEHYVKINSELKRKALESVYADVVTQDVPVWEEDTDLLKWLQEFCK